MDIKNLIFEGGGVKGIAYAGALEVLQDQAILDNVENVAGTSAGAITATLVALNYRAETIKSIIIQLNFRKFEDGFNPFRLFTSYGFYKGNFFLAWIEERISDIGLPKDITFAQLAEKKIYKNLKLFATDLNDRNIQEFSVQTTPETKIAEAVRASMSIPLFFKAFQFSNAKPNNHIYVDGGVLYNYPLSIFNNLDQTIGFYLSNTNAPKKKDNLKFWQLIQYIKNVFDTLLQAQNIAFEENKNLELHTVIINDLNVSATDFKLSQKTKLQLIQQGKIATKKFLGINNLLD